MAQTELGGDVNGMHQGNTYRRIELITGDTRRRRWSPEEKAAILAESCQPGASVSEVARRHGVNRNLVGTWRRQARRNGAGDDPALVPIRILEEVTTTAGPAGEARPKRVVSRSAPGSIDIETGGVRVRVNGAADAAALQQVLGYLGGRR